MNVAILCFHALGGSGVVAAEIARELVRRGHRAHFVGPALPGRLDPTPAGVVLHPVSLEQAAPVGGQAYALALAARLIELLRSEHVDLIHAHYAIPHAAAALLARQAVGQGAPKFVLSLHGSDVPTALTSEGQVVLTRHLVTSADAVTTPSRALAAQARERLKLGDLPIEIAPNFVDTDRFRPAPAAAREVLAPFFPDLPASVRVLCHASNFRPVKRAIDVLHAFAIVRAERPTRLLFAGDGPERPNLEAEVRSLGLQREVAFTGPKRDLAQLLTASDLFVMPSVTESFGLAALEAMSCGVPVLATRSGGLPEVIEDGQTGLLVPVGDVRALAAAALRLLTDEPARARMAHAARERALRHFQVVPAVDRWEALFTRLIG